MTLTSTTGSSKDEDFVEIEFGDPESILVQDDDAHWYVIPHDKLDVWAIWATEDCPVLPDWATSVERNPSSALFKEYRIL